jgi:hypothetical protein
MDEAVAPAPTASAVAAATSVVLNMVLLLPSGCIGQPPLVRSLRESFTGRALAPMIERSTPKDEPELNGLPRGSKTRDVVERTPDKVQEEAIAEIVTCLNRVRN